MDSSNEQHAACSMMFNRRCRKQTAWAGRV